jgi:hypothetical protein
MWRQTYSKLTEFVHKNPQIQITAEKIIIPQDVRQQFWQTFDETRREFIKQNFSNFIEETSLLGENYVKTEKEIISLLNLEEIALPQPLKEFIQNPEKALMRELFDPLFDLLKGKIDAETFEEGSSKKVTESIKKYYPKAYILWLELSIMKLLEPDKVFQVPIPKVTIRHARVFLRYAQVRMWDVPHPKETKTISPEHNVASTFIVPDFIIHSKRLNRFMAFRSEAGTAVWTASNPSEKREWIPIPPALVRLGYLDILIYMDETPDNINLIADSQRICRPEIIIQCIVRKEWSKKEAKEKAKLYNETLKPKIGTFIISKEPIEEKTENGIQTLSVGLNQSKLEPVIKALTSLAKEKPQHTP